MELERNRTKNFDFNDAFDWLVENDPIILQQVGHDFGSGKTEADPWISRCHWNTDLFDAARMNDIARRG